MNTSTTAERLVNSLKLQLRLRGLHYKDVATRLGVSEGTVKRYFSGKGLSIDVLERLAATVELDLLSLMDLVQQNANGELSGKQWSALTRDKRALAVFYFLGLGFKPAQLVEEFGLADEMDGILAGLEALGLVRRLRANNVKVLAKVTLTSELAKKLEDLRLSSSQAFLSDIDLRDEQCEWMYYPVRLSRAGTTRLREAMNRFACDLEALTKSEIGVPPNETTWYRVFIGAQPTGRELLLRPETNMPPSKSHKR